MVISPEFDEASIVLVGSMNPLIFRPEWFSRHDLLPNELADNADIEVIHQEISAFKSDWLTLRVERNRFISSTCEQPFVRLHDLVSKTFGDFLIHTPIGKMGINRKVDFPTPSSEVRDKIGKILAPREPWGQWGEYIDKADERGHGGLTNITLEERALTDRPAGKVQVVVQPSNISDHGIQMAINDHYEISDPDNATDCEEILNILSQKFESSMDRSAWIIDQIMQLVKQQG